MYHPKCVPAGPSRDSLDKNEDPWFCPKCIKKKSRRSDKEDRLSSQHRCTDCNKVVDGLSVVPCDECGNYVHHPSCRTDAVQSKRPLCATCFAVDALSKEDEAEFQDREAEEDNADDENGPAEDEGSQMDASGTGMSQLSDDEASGVRHSRRKKRKLSIDEGKGKSD